MEISNKKTKPKKKKVTYEKKPYKRIRLGRSFICLTSLDRAIIDCIMSYVKSRGKVDRIGLVYNEVWKKVKPAIVIYHIWKCLLILNHKQKIRLRNWKYPKKEKWRTEIYWTG